MGSDEGGNEFAKERESESRTAVLIGRRTEREGEEERREKESSAPDWESWRGKRVRQQFVDCAELQLRMWLNDGFQEKYYEQFSVK